MKATCIVLALMVFANQMMGQDNTEDVKQADKKHKSLSLGVGGKGLVHYNQNKDNNNDEESKAEDGKFDVHYGVLDLGLNYLVDKTNYSATAAQNFLHVPSAYKNAALFDMNQGKSVNVNIYPVMVNYMLFKTENFHLHLCSGLGLQFYNFRFNKNINYANNPNNFVFIDTVSFSKNKLALDYLNIPLELLLKHRIGNDNWLVYGFGVTGGFLLDSWTKQISAERGKTHNHSQFDFNPFNSCLSAEIGIDDIIRLYATYQLTALESSGLLQYPFCIGFRIGGI